MQGMVTNTPKGFPFFIKLAKIGEKTPFEYLLGVVLFEMDTHEPL